MKIKTANLYNVDCMKLMKDKPDDYYDLAIVDPPYGISADKKNSIRKLQSKKSEALSADYGNQKWDNCIPSIDYFEALFRVSKNQIIWGVNYYPYPLFVGGRIYWNKRVTMPTYSDGEIAFCSKMNSIKQFNFTWHGMIQENMKNKETRIHPTQKPIKLYEWILGNYAKVGDKILDTHGGSMSSVIACLNMGYEIDCCELDRYYFNLAVERIKIHQFQLAMDF